MNLGPFKLSWVSDVSDTGNTHSMYNTIDCVGMVGLVGLVGIVGYIEIRRKNTKVDFASVRHKNTNKKIPMCWPEPIQFNQICTHAWPVSGLV